MEVKKLERHKIPIYANKQFYVLANAFPNNITKCTYDDEELEKYEIKSPSYHSFVDDNILIIFENYYINFFDLNENFIPYLSFHLGFFMGDVVNATKNNIITIDKFCYYRKLRVYDIFSLSVIFQHSFVENARLYDDCIFFKIINSGVYKKKLNSEDCEEMLDIKGKNIRFFKDFIKADTRLYNVRTNLVFETNKKVHHIINNALIYEKEGEIRVKKYKDYNCLIIPPGFKIGHKGGCFCIFVSSDETLVLV